MSVELFTSKQIRKECAPISAAQDRYDERACSTRNKKGRARSGCAEREVARFAKSDTQLMAQHTTPVNATPSDGS